MYPMPTSKRRESASTLILVIFVVALLVVFIGLALDYTAHTARTSARAGDYTRAQALANGALEAAYKRWQVYMASKQASVIGSYTTPANFQSITGSLAAQINSAASSSGFTITSLNIIPVDRADNAVASQAKTYASVGPMTNVPGWTATTYTYCAQAVATKTADTSLVVSVSRYFQQADASLFQAMLFFQNDLELHPGPAMTLYGLVHTNANMYAAAGSGGSITFSSNVSYHGSQSTLNAAANYKYKDPTGYVEGVTTTLYNQESGNWTTYNPPSYANTRSAQLSNVQALYPLGTDESGAIDPTNGNASGTHEIIERPVPNSSTDPNANTASVDPSAFSAHRVYNSAGLRVFINHSVAYTTPGNDAPSQIHVYTPDASNPENSVEIIPGTTPTTQNIANQIIAAITPDNAPGNIYDFREGRTINANTVDVSVLTPALNAYPGYNGVVYIADVTDADANGNTGNSDAIRLKKGGVLPDNGLTVVTDGAVYIQGDYNTGTTYGADLPNGAVTIVKQPASNTAADPSQYTVTGYTQKPAAVMGDAVMILSNNWVDGNSSLAIGTRVATPTTFNAAIVSGAVLTTASAASGGAHNFPRFLENWSGMNFTYHGSMCELYASLHFTGTYGKSNVYSPPNRRWFFDDNFLTTPPPGNLRTTTYTRGRWIRNNNS